MTPERSVLHVLPHPGGGGETYVGLLAEMPGYRFTRCFLALTTSPSPLDILRGFARATRLARKHDLLHVHGEAAAALCLPLLAVLPSVVTLHGLHLVRRLEGARRRVAVLNLRAILRAADATICVSQAEHSYLEGIVGPKGAARTIVARNGVRVPPPTTEEERRQTRAELGLDPDAVVAIWVGSLDERKDPLTAVRAAERAGVTLLVVGDGPLRRPVEVEAGERIHVLGRRADVRRLLDAADVYILTSHREGLALSLLEAMAHGLPSVVTNLAENVEAVGDTGLAASSGDEAALGAAIRSLATRTHMRVALGARARQRAAGLFDVERMFTDTRAVYDRVARGHLGCG